MAENSQAAPVVGVFTTDTELRIKVWDNALVRFTGISAEKARGQLVHELFPEIKTRGHIGKLQNVLQNGTVEILAQAFHRYLIACPPQSPSKRFERMRQRVTIAPVVEDEWINGLLVTIEDVTARVEREQELSEQLKSADAETRLRAAEVLAHSDEVANELNLVGSIGDSDWRVRQAAIGGIAKRSAPEAIHALLEMMREDHRNLAVLNSALQVLSMVDVDTKPTLLEFLHSPDADLRMQAALALGEQRDSTVVPALLDALNDADMNVRFHVIEALGKLNDSRAVDPLIEIAKSGKFFLSFPAIEALKDIGDASTAVSLRELLSIESLQEPVAEVLGALGDETAIAPLASVINTSPDGVIVPAKALAKIHDRFEEKHSEGEFIADLTRQAIKPSGIQHLLSALNDANLGDLRSLALVIGWLRGPSVDHTLVRLLGEPSVRDEVLEALAHHGEGVISLLIDQLRSEDIEIRKAAVNVLGRLGYRKATEPLTRVLENDDATLRVEAANALARIGDEAALDSLLRMIGDSNAAVRQAVVGALNSIGSSKMPEKIKVLLRDDNPLVRESAAKIAGYFGYVDCADLLLQSANDENERVRQAAVEHLPFIEDDRVLPLLAEKITTETPRVRAAAAVALANVDGSESGLMKALKDHDSWVRYFAARSLGRLESKSALEPLIEVANNDQFNHVRISALEALGKIGGKKAIDAINQHLKSNDSDVARVAAKALQDAGIGSTK